MEIFFLILAVSSPWVLGYGFLIGLKHATEADHLAAVSAIVTERKSLFGSALVGGLWGLGHTISLFIAGIFVLLLNFQISEQTERALEFCVGIMLTLLGLNVLRKLWQGGTLHFHEHRHGELIHAHPHIHEKEKEDTSDSHHGLSLSPRALFIGMIHGLAGSAALMLIIIPTIESKTLGLLYIIVFGIGSIGGMMLMSFLVGLPFHFARLRLNGFNLILRGLAGAFSFGLGLWIIYEKAVIEKLFI